MILTIKPNKISIFVANCQYSAEQVRKITGADVVLNGTLYDFTTLRPCQDVKVDGRVLSDELPAYEGYGWNSDSTTMARSNNMSKWQNFISCADIIKDGRKIDTSKISWLAGARQRTAIGWKADGTMIIYAEQRPKTIEQVKEEMRAAGVVDAINLDGGGSTQISTSRYGSLFSARKVHNYICVWGKGGTNSCPYAEPTALVMQGSSGEGAKWVQWNLWRRGYKGANGRELEIDGIFGSNSSYALRNFQRDNGLAVDGLCGINTRAVLRR